MLKIHEKDKQDHFSDIFKTNFPLTGKQILHSLRTVFVWYQIEDIDLVRGTWKRDRPQKYLLYKFKNIFYKS